MRHRSKRVACIGLELACFVAERLGGFLDRTGSFAFDWDAEGGKMNGGGGGDAWNGGIAAASSGGDSSGTSAESASPPPHPRRRWDPHRFDLAAFLQVLVDVMVSCPLPDLRARGHGALSAFLGAADEACRFRVLRRLVERCPWPNATGLLLDAFRREVYRALRQSWREQQQQQRELCPAEPAAAAAEAKRGAARVSAPTPSPFASVPAGDFVCEQLRRACRRGTPAALMMDMDSRTGGLTLARYAYALDVPDAGLGQAAGGRLKLRQPERLLQNRLLVQGLLEDLRGAAITPDSAGPEHFRLFILEHAAQQCLEELQRYE
ncbi:unnamed protein product [Hapterophycus canaliculatus]